MWISPETDFSAFELDELFWFIKTRKDNEMGVNTYLMTMVSRFPRQIVAFDVDKSVKAKVIQQMVNSVPVAKNYFTDGGSVYLDVDFCGRHRRNIHNKNDTYIVEGTNADIRNYIAGLKRKSRCFFRSRENLKIVLWIFINAYNKFGHAKRNYTDRQPPFSILNFL